MRLFFACAVGLTVLGNVERSNRSIVDADAIGELIAPVAAQYAQTQRSIALSDRISLKTTYGFWTRDGQSFINIRDILPGERLGDISIYEFDDARRLRQEKLTQAVPVVMLTARTQEEDKVRGLDTGADDYITKPFSPRELIARIKALLRRTAPRATDEPVEVNGLTLDPVTHRVLAGERKLSLGPMEFRLLHFFMTHPERVHSRERILDSVWGANVYVEERTVDVHIRRLRKALSTHGHDRLVQTVRGAGYRFSARV